MGKCRGELGQAVEAKLVCLVCRWGVDEHTMGIKQHMSILPTEAQMSSNSWMEAGTLGAIGC